MRESAVRRADPDADADDKEAELPPPLDTTAGGRLRLACPAAKEAAAARRCNGVGPTKPRTVALEDARGFTAVAKGSDKIAFVNDRGTPPPPPPPLIEPPITTSPAKTLAGRGDRCSMGGLMRPVGDDR